jgi:hypothetical protein
MFLAPLLVAVLAGTAWAVDGDADGLTAACGV